MVATDGKIATGLIDALRTQPVLLVLVVLVLVFQVIDARQFRSIASGIATRDAALLQLARDCIAK